MPKSSHFQTQDVATTDRKNRPEDEGIIQQEKQEFQSSEKAKKSDAMSEREFITRQDEKNEN